MEKGSCNGFWAGVDLAKAAFEAALAPLSATPAERTRLEVRSFDNTAAGVLELAAWIEDSPGECLGICVEATGGYSERFARMAARAGLATAIVNPARPLMFARSMGVRDKSDRVDAAVLALYGAMHRPAARPPRSADHQRLRDLWRLREDYLEQRTMTQLRLQQAEDPLAVRLLRTTVRQLERAIDQVEAALREQIAAAERWREDERLLRTIPGIGEVTAWLLLAELGDLREWSREELVGYAGLFPRTYESGTSVRRRPRMARGGGGRLRRGLFMAAFGLRSKKGALPDYAQRLVDAGKAKMCAIGALMRKLLIVARAVVASGQAFDPQRIGSKNPA